MPHQLHRRQILMSGVATTGLALAGTSRAQLPAPPPLEVYARSPFIEHIDLSPDANTVAIVTRQGAEQFLKTLDRRARAPHSANLGPVKVRDIFWADNSRVTVVTSVKGALPQYGGFEHELSQAFIVDPATGKTKLLWDKEAAIANPVIAGNLKRIKTASGYQVTAGNFIGFDAYCVAAFSPDVDAPVRANDLANAYKIQSLPCLPYQNQDVLLAPDGRIVAAGVMSFDGSRGVTKSWALQRNSSTSARPFMKEIWRTTYSVEAPQLLGLSADGQGVVVALFDDGWTFHTVGPDGEVGPSLDTAVDSAPRSPLFHPVTGRFAGFLRHGDDLAYEYADPILKTVAASLPAAMGEGYRTRIVSFAEDPRQLIVHVEGDDEAGGYYFLDLVGGANDLLGEDYPGLPSEWLAKRSAITYKAGDGLDIPAFLTLPPYRATKNLPLVVLPHGGPEARDRAGFDWQAQALASRGYAVLQPNFRGSSGYSLAFTRAGYGEFGRRMQTDLSDGVRHLAAQGIVDPKRVAICGASYGGYAALAGVTLQDGIYRCAISIAGVADLDYMQQRTKTRSNTRYSDSLLYWQRYFGETPLDQISPVRHAGKASAPVLLIHGRDDTVVEYEHSVRMEKALRTAGKPVELVSYDGQDHWETIESARIDMIRRVVGFLEKHNPS